ncbi:MAG: hypothetical protein ACR2NF_08560 [Pirellulales bacterium]
MEIKPPGKWTTGDLFLEACDGNLRIHRSHQRHDLSLDGLTELSDAAGESLSKLRGSLSLRGLTNMSDAVADQLAWRLLEDRESIDLPSLRKLQELRQRGCDIAQKAITLAKTKEAWDSKEEAWQNFEGDLEPLSECIDT